jgi:hypothetical protein
MSGRLWQSPPKNYALCYRDENAQLEREKKESEMGDDEEKRRQRDGFTLLHL